MFDSNLHHLGDEALPCCGHLVLRHLEVRRHGPLGGLPPEVEVELVRRAQRLREGEVGPRPEGDLADLY